MKFHIIVTGIPASGKSTVGRAIATALGIPMLDKDEFLEALFHSQGIGDAEWRAHLSRTADQSLREKALTTDAAVITSWWRHPSSTVDSGTPVEWLSSLAGFKEVAQFFVQRGWAVVIPARRGRAGSEGLYDKGFEVDRSRGYSCVPMLSIVGADRALNDIAAAMDTILAMPFVDPERVVIGGQSRGGILSVAYAGQHPDQVKGVINFVGGWMGTGCTTAEKINQEIFQRGARFPGDTLRTVRKGASGNRSLIQLLS